MGYHRELRVFLILNCTAWWWTDAPLSIIKELGLRMSGKCRETGVAEPWWWWVLRPRSLHFGFETRSAVFLFQGSEWVCEALLSKRSYDLSPMYLEMMTLFLWNEHRVHCIYGFLLPSFPAPLATYLGNASSCSCSSCPLLVSSTITSSSFSEVTLKTT